jgi:uncharacterized protein
MPAIEMLAGEFLYSWGRRNGKAIAATLTVKMVTTPASTPRDSSVKNDIRLFFNIEPEFVRPLAQRPIGALARSVVVSSLADAILISGAMAGAEVDLDHIREAKSAVPNTPVLANTGVKIETVRATLAVADGVIVGTGLKRDGYTWNPVDPERVRRFMDEVYLAREQSED